MKKQHQSILEKVTILIILIANIIQGSWWIYLAINEEYIINYQLCILQTICLLTRICQSLLIYKNLGLKLFLHVVSLLYYIVYIESFLLLQYNQPLDILTNSFLMMIAYIQYVSIAVQKLSQICKIGLPIYLVTRTIWILISSFKLQNLENLVIVIVFFIWRQKKMFKMISLFKKQKNNLIRNLLQLLKIIQCIHKQNHKAKQQIKSPKKCFTILLKDLPDEHKLKQYSNLTSFSRSQKFNRSFVSSQNSMFQLYQNLINLFPHGLLILNQAQQINYINKKCEKILECQGSELVLEKVKMCVNSAKMQDNLSELSNKVFKKQLHYYALQQIVKKLQSHNLPFDVLDIILQPQKYFEILEHNQIQISKDILQSFNQQIFIYEWFIKSELMIHNFQKKLKLIIIPTSMTNQQQEYFSAPSQIKSSSKSHFSNSNDPENPVLLIIIKNITSKYKCQQLRDEQIIHHSLIKSFSHELRTPLNSCQQMLNLMKYQSSTKNYQEYLDIAQCSITLLIHQINDILDYAAIQSFSFSYNIQNFTLNQIIEEIEHLYKIQMAQKSIEFKIEISEQLINKSISNDKQRITQLLVNLLNNSVKFTQEGGTICLSIIEVNILYINIIVKDNGIGIDEHKLNQIQNSLHDTLEFGAFMKSHSAIKQLGLGLNIAAKLIEGLVESKDNKLIINSKKSKGTIVQFQIENYQYKNQMSSHLPNPQSEKLSFQRHQTQGLLDYDEIIQTIKENPKIKNQKEYIDKDLDSYNNTSRLNDLDKQPQIFLPVSPCYFSNKFNYSNEYLQNQQESQFPTRQQSICQNCIHILIVDDIPFNQIALKMILQKFSMEADQAFDGYQAIEMVKQKQQQHCQTYKLIFMDIEMPGIDGFQTSKHILEITSNQTFIVICSAYDTQENLQQGRNLGINTFIIKPVKQDELGVVLNQVFEDK
ncbi:unnamed protein product [Paramecium sonneborni]|uniref:Uncharacterized protein n=1 Tax=Paramecium sonneborni TaxID=65129 RepID=A0A8S1RGB0_9CILI|nr:unnamed protein product [Paramecium sonneborni]